MIFQEPMTSLNPVHTIGAQIGETLRRHQPLSAARRASGPSNCSTWCALPRAAAPHRRPSAQPVGRPASARDDRHGRGLPSRAC
jgi:peptide/nickel transport system ATP-binding protein